MAQPAKLRSRSNDEQGEIQALGRPLPSRHIPGRKGRANTHTSTSKSPNAPAPAILAAGQREVHLHLRINFDRFAVQQVRLVLPLLHRLDRGRSQHRVTADQLQVLDVASLADLRLQDHRSLNTSLTRQRRVRRIYPADQQALRNARRHTYALRGGDLRHSNVRSRAGYAAQHAAHRPARYSTRNSAHDARRGHDRWRRLFFLNHLNFLRNLGRSAQLAVDDVGLDHLYNFDRCSSWRWRWWRRRGCHQES